MRRPINATRGVTLTELLVVMLIISLLATVAVPVYINRMEDARVRLAKAETREIAQAEEQVGLIHGFYVPFQVLDDSPEVNGLSSTNEDLITLEPTNIYVVNPLIRPEDQLGSQSPDYQLVLTSPNPRVRTLINDWEGPFLNPQRVYLGNDDRGPGDPDYSQSAFFRLDFPLDPWGEPYRFYSPLGIIGSSAYSIQQPYGSSFSDGLLTTTDDRNFDRYVVMSWGRNNRPDHGSLSIFGQEDDIVYFFGSPGIESNFGRL